jgi:hypothetical protein
MDFTSEQHQRNANGDIVIEPAGKTIARMREKQRDRNFVHGVIISALALAVVLTGTLLGVTSKYNADLRSQLENMQNDQSASTQQLNGNNGTGDMTGQQQSGTYTQDWNTNTGTTDDMTETDTTGTFSGDRTQTRRGRWGRGRTGRGYYNNNYNGGNRTNNNTNDGGVVDLPNLPTVQNTPYSSQPFTYDITNV